MPLLLVLRRKVKGKDGKIAETVECPFKLICHRIVDCLQMVEELMKNPGGKQMSAEEHLRSWVSDLHFSPIAARELGGARRGCMRGDIMMALSLEDLECVATARGVRLVVLDMVKANVQVFGPMPHPCRLAASFW